MKPIRITNVALLLCACLTTARGSDAVLTIDAAQPVAQVSPTLYGLMTEEISHSYDGGLYAELVQNRAFLDDQTEPAHWSLVQAQDAQAAFALDKDNPLDEQLPVSLRLNVASASPKRPVDIANDGYWGIPVKPNTLYQASFYARAADGFSGPVKVAIISADQNTIYAEAKSRSLTSDWQRYEVTLKTGKMQPTSQARLVIRVEHPGTVWFDLVSLFPPTWNHRPNGLRPDIMQMLVDLKPSFLRFPGGNYVEGDTIETRFDWKKTIGPIDQRPGHAGPWGYRSSDGLGLMEFLLWCEDMNAQPVLAVYAGYSLKGAHVNPGPDLNPFVQDALDEIEYVTGPVSSKWGAQRAKDGHPAPFKLHYVEIGNEDWFDKSGSYDGRFAQFADAIKAKYPKLECISTVGTEQPVSKRVHSRQPDVLDEHYYRSAATFLKDAPIHFEHYDRKGPKIFVGEWAAYENIVPWSKESKTLPRTPSMKAALGDAAWMTAMERNSDIIRMQCYAPMFVNVNPGASQWRPNLIGYDALHVFGSPSYYAIWMFSRNHGDQILKADSTDSTVQYEVTKDSKSGAIFIKLVNAQTTPQSLSLNIKGIRNIDPTGMAITLAATPDEDNSIENPTKVAPVTSRISGVKPAFDYTMPANSIVVLKLETR